MNKCCGRPPGGAALPQNPRPPCLTHPEAIGVEDTGDGVFGVCCHHYSQG